MRKMAMIVLGLHAAACTGTGVEGEEMANVSPTPASVACNSPQAFGNSQHSGGQNCPALHGMHVVQQIVQDPDADAISDQDGFYQFYGMPVLTIADFVFIPTKSGFTTVDHRETERYHVQGYRWFPSVHSPARQLVGPMWTSDTDWMPVDAVVNPTYITFGYVQGFAAAFSGFVWIPAASGQILQIDPQNGNLVRRIDPFVGTALSGDSKLTSVGYPSVDIDGSVWYAAVAWPTTAGAATGDPVRGSYVVRISPVTGASQIVDLSPDNAIKIAGSGIATHAVGVKTASDLCPYPFGFHGSPLPTGPDSIPTAFPCGPQRPNANSAIAFTSHGPLIHTVSNNTRNVAYLIEVDRSTMQPIRAVDTEDNHLAYGCGVRLGLDVGNCAVLTANGTTNLGVDPVFGAHAGVGRALDLDDIDSQAPMVAPDGSWVWGGYDTGVVFDSPGASDDAQGALMRWSSTGTFLTNNQRFGWNATPTAVPTAGGFRFALDQEIYNQFDLRVAIEDPSFTDLVSGVSTNEADGADFVDAQVTVDTEGGFYGVTEGDGLFHHFDAAGNEIETLQLTRLDGSPADEFTMPVHTVSDAAGDRFVTAGGIVNVVMSGAAAPASRVRRTIAPGGHAAKRRALRSALAHEPTLAGRAVPNVCTADDPTCGAPGTNPSPAETAANASRGWYASQADSGSERISCSHSGDEYTCQVTFSILGNFFGGWCTVIGFENADGSFHIVSISCTAALPR